MVRYAIDWSRALSCRRYEIATKEEGLVRYTTSYIESREVGWPCGGANDATLRSECSARGGSVIDSQLGGLQCVCHSERTVQPVAVESMRLSFEHSTTAFERTLGAPMQAS